MNIKYELITKNTLHEYYSYLTLIAFSIHSWIAALNCRSKWIWFIGATFNHRNLPRKPLIQLDREWIPL